MEWLTPEMIASVGFPIAISSYLLVKLQPAIDKLTQAVNNQTTIITLLMDREGKKIE